MGEYEYQSSEVFAVLLSRLDGKLFRTGDIIKLHKLFYGLAQKNPVHMAKFKFRKRTNPYCLTLQDLIVWFDKIGVLCWVGMESMMVDRLRLQEFLPINDSVYQNFDGLDALSEL
jgi:hypothetical protein